MDVAKVLSIGGNRMIFIPLRFHFAMDRFSADCIRLMRPSVFFLFHINKFAFLQSQHSILAE